MKTKRIKTTTAFLLAACGVMTSGAKAEGISVGDEIFYWHGAGPGESLVVAGKQVIVAMPNEVEDGIFQSLMPTIIHKANNQIRPFTQSVNVSLAGGEVTDVAAFRPDPDD